MAGPASFDVLRLSADEWAVIYRYDKSWGIYQSSICNEETATEIADALNAYKADPEGP